METQIVVQSARTNFSSFSEVWLGQVVSLLGSSLISFALGMWVYQATGKVTDYALIVLFMVIPTLLLSLISGALVDRWNYQIVMSVSDFASALVTLIIAALFHVGRLELWHVYIAASANVYSCYPQCGR